MVDLNEFFLVVQISDQLLRMHLCNLLLQRLEHRLCEWDCFSFVSMLLAKLNILWRSRLATHWHSRAHLFRHWGLLVELCVNSFDDVCQSRVDIPVLDNRPSVRVGGLVDVWMSDARSHSHVRAGIGKSLCQNKLHWKWCRRDVELQEERVLKLLILLFEQVQIGVLLA